MWRLPETTSSQKKVLSNCTCLASDKAVSRLSALTERWVCRRATLCCGAACQVPSCSYASWTQHCGWIWPEIAVCWAQQRGEEGLSWDKKAFVVSPHRTSHTNVIEVYSNQWVFTCSVFFLINRECLWLLFLQAWKWAVEPLDGLHHTGWTSYLPRSEGLHWYLSL